MAEQHAELYRMVTAEHICPFGLKSRYLLKRKHILFEDHKLESREQADRFKDRVNVETTPQIYIDGKRIGGYDALRSHFGLDEEGQTGTTYVPVLVIFIMALLMAAGLTWSVSQTLLLPAFPLRFIAISMCLLAIQKLRDITAFTNQFITYDLLSMRWVPYAHAYAILEAWAGIGMLAGLPVILVAPVAIFIGVEGGISVFKAVYIERRELKCACVGGGSNVPLGSISLTENLMMVLAGFAMLLA